MTDSAAVKARALVLQHFQWRDGDGDLWPLYADSDGFAAVVGALAAPFVGGVTRVVGVEARGFLLGGAVARELGVGFVAIRKRAGQLPGDKLVRRSEPDYTGERQVLRLRADALTETDRVLIVDDWLETAAQARAAEALIRDAGATVAGHSVIINQHPDRTDDLVNVHSLLTAAELPPHPCC